MSRFTGAIHGLVSDSEVARELFQVKRSDQREAIAGGGERSQVERSDPRWRGAIPGGGERSQVESSDRRWRGAIAGGEERSQVDGSDRRWRGVIVGEGERSQVEGSDRRWREAIAGGRSDCRWREALAGGEKLSQPQVERSDRNLGIEYLDVVVTYSTQWPLTILCGREGVHRLQVQVLP